MPLTPSDLQDGVLGLGALAVSGTAIAKTWATVRKGADVRRVQLQETREAVTRMEPVLEMIRGHFLPNGGMSLTDIVNSIRHDILLERTARRVLTAEATYEVVITPEGVQKVVFVSPEWVRLTGLGRDECEQDGWARIVLEVERERVQRMVFEAQKRGHVYAVEYTMEHIATGDRVGVRHTGTPVVGPKGVILGWIGVVRQHPEDEL